MFKHCVWYSIKPHHPIHQCIRQNASIFGTCIFPGHITIKHSLEKDEAMILYDQYKNANVPVFSPYGKLYMSTTYINNRFFFAIEQALSVNGVKINNIHVSLAYRFDEPFTAMDIALINDVFLQDIRPEDLKICIANCSSENIDDWTIYT